MINSFLEKSHPEHAEEQREAMIGELCNLGKSIRAWQKSRKPALSDAKLISRFPGLGSDKTYSKIHGGNPTELDVEKQLINYRGVWSAIEHDTAGPGDEELYDDLQPATEVKNVVLEMLPLKSLSRLVVIQGPSGSGKTRSLELLADHLGTSAVLKVEANEAWSSATFATGELVKAAGAIKADERMPMSLGARLEKFLNKVGDKRKILFIDESHHLNGRTLNVIKTIINQTNLVIVLAGIGTLWVKLTAAYNEEARQLLLNRMHARVILKGPTRRDVVLYLGRRSGVKLATDGKLTKTIQGVAAEYGNYAFLRRLTEKIADLSGSEAIDETLVTQALHAVIADTDGR